jgi:hypothetical protein
MKPEELFKIQDTEIPEINEETTSSSPENTVSENKKIDVFDKDLTLDDLIKFLDKNDISNNSKIVEKYYEQIILNNKEKESITEIIKELDHQKEVFTNQIEREPENKNLLRKIQDLEEKISDLNTEERIKEDNVKTIIREISQTNNEKIETLEIKESPSNELRNDILPEIKPENIKQNQESQIKPEEMGLNQESQIKPEEMGLNQESQIKPEEMGLNQESQIKPEEMGLNQESQIKPEEIEILKKSTTDEDVKKEFENIQLETDERDANFVERLKTLSSSEEEKEIFKVADKNETLEEVKKNADILKKMSQNINDNFELILKALSENFKESNKNNDNDLNNIEAPNYIESPKISQPQYITEYRKSLRKYGGMESFLGYDAPFKADNLGSYI